MTNSKGISINNCRLHFGIQFIDSQHLKQTYFVDGIELNRFTILFCKEFVAEQRN